MNDSVVTKNDIKAFQAELRSVELRLCGVLAAQTITIIAVVVGLVSLVR